MQSVLALKWILYFFFVVVVFYAGVIDFLELKPYEKRDFSLSKNSQAYEVALCMCIPFLYFKIILVITEMNTPL